MRRPRWITIKNSVADNIQRLEDRINPLDQQFKPSVSRTDLLFCVLNLKNIVLKV